MRDTKTYPSPVIALGSQHTVNQAMLNQGGTVVQLHAWNSILGMEERYPSVHAGTLCWTSAMSMHAHACGAQACAVTEPAVSSSIPAALRRTDELLPGQGKKVVRLQPGVKMLQLARWLDAKGYECSFAPGVASNSRT